MPGPGERRVWKQEKMHIHVYFTCLSLTERQVGFHFVISEMLCHDRFRLMDSPKNNWIIIQV